MSLGIKTLWRARPTFTGGPGISTIPRELRRWFPAATNPAATNPSLQLPSRRLHLSSTERGSSSRAVLQENSLAESVTNDALSDAFGAQSKPLSPSSSTTVDRTSPSAVAQPDASKQNREEPPVAMIETGDHPITNARNKKRASRKIPWQATSPSVRQHIDNYVHDMEDSATPGPASTESSSTQSKHDSVLVIPAVNYHHAQETALSHQRHHESITRQLRLEVIRRATQKPLPDWRVILENIRRMTAQRSGPWREAALKVTVSARLVDLLVYEVDHSIWDIYIRTGCRIALYKKDSSRRLPTSTPDDGGYLILSGDQIALDEAVAEIAQISGAASGESAVINLQRGNGESTESQTTLTDWKQEHGQTILQSTELGHRPSNLPRYRLSHRAEDIPKPKQWTRETFAAYIAALTRANLPPNLAHEFYGSGVAADEAFLSLLHKAFNDETARAALSTRAFKMALDYMESRGHSYRAHARALFVRMEMLNLPMDTDVFNILLASSVAVRDLRNFDAMLKLMLGRGHVPNLKTWSLFLQIIESEEVKRHIVNTMHSRGLLDDPRAMQMVARELVEHDIRQVRANWPGIQNFLKDQDTKYGSSWMTKTAMNRIMNELARLGKLASCLDFLDIMLKSKKIPPTTVTLNIILSHARAHSHPALAIAVLQRTLNHNIQMDETSYHELAGLATNLRKQNALALIWLHASLNAKTSYSMRTRFSKLTPLDALSAYFPHDAASESKPENNSAAQFKRKRTSAWVPELPLHELLEDVLEADRAIETQVRKAKEDPTVPDVEIRGLRVSLRRRKYNSAEERMERKYVDTTPLVWRLAREQFRNARFGLTQAEPLNHRLGTKDDGETSRPPQVGMRRRRPNLTFRKLY